jgi:hypothetical protein
MVTLPAQSVLRRRNAVDEDSAAPSITIDRDQTADDIVAGRTDGRAVSAERKCVLADRASVRLNACGLGDLLSREAAQSKANTVALQYVGDVSRWMP